MTNTPETKPNEELIAFMITLRRALLMIVHYIEKRYMPNRPTFIVRNTDDDKKT